MEKSAAVQLAEVALPKLRERGLCNFDAIKSVKNRNLLALWTGMGSVDELVLTGENGESCSFVTKSIGSYKEVEDDPLALVDHMSYYNEARFYESDVPDRIADAGCRCPRPLFVERKTGKDDGVVTIGMTKLIGGHFRRTKEGMEAALSWLAQLHALFWGPRADEAVASGLAEHACFWNLVRRDIELNKMGKKDPLRLAAAGIHARLVADKMQTMCHGDAKSANIMWDDDDGVAFYDFQWFGKGPVSRDLAYFIGINGSEPEQDLLQYYHGVLCKLLEAQGDTPPSYEYLWDSYSLAQADLWRWMTGGFSFGNTRLISRHAKAVLKKLEGCSTEEEYRDKIFEVFPP